MAIPQESGTYTFTGATTVRLFSVPAGGIIPGYMAFVMPADLNVGKGPVMIRVAGTHIAPSVDKGATLANGGIILRPGSKEYVQVGRGEILEVYGEDPNNTGAIIDFYPVGARHNM